LNLAQFAQNKEFKEAGLTDAIIRSLQEQESESQFRDPFEMRNIMTDSSVCTLQSI